MASGYYPMGAENDPNAPYNEEGTYVPVVHVTKTLTFELSRDIFLDVTDYCGSCNDPDFTWTDWLDVYHKNGMKTPSELLGELKKIAQKKIGGLPKYPPTEESRFWLGIYRDCQFWEEQLLSI